MGIRAALGLGKAEPDRGEERGYDMIKGLMRHGLRARRDACPPNPRRPRYHRRPIGERLEGRWMLSLEGFLPEVEYLGAAEPVWVAHGDVNRDGDLDLIVADRQTGDVLVLRGDGDGTFQSTPLSYPARSGLTSVTTGDLNGDGYLDLIFTGRGAVTPVTVLLNQGGQYGNWQGFAAPVDYDAGSEPAAAEVTDLNGDGHLDLAIAAAEGVFVRAGRGDGTFHEVVCYTTGAGRHAVAVGDVDGDGVSDLVVSNEVTRHITVLRGEGDGSFEQLGAPIPVEKLGYVATGDLDDDGDLDLVAAHFSGTDNISVLLGEGDGTFTEGSLYSLRFLVPRSLKIADMDADGSLDLVVARFWMEHYFPVPPGEISLLLGSGDGSFDSPIHLGPQRDSTSVSVADFDGNGRPDLAMSVAERGDYGNQCVSLMLGIRQGTGDFDSNGRVDGDDFLAWQDGFGTPSGATLSDGDADRDGDVDGDDFLVWQTEFGSGEAAAGAGSVVAPTHAPLALPIPARGRVLKTGIPASWPMLRARLIDRGIAEWGIRGWAITQPSNLKASVLADDLLSDMASTLSELGIRDRAITHSTKLKTSILDDELLSDLASTLAELGSSPDDAAAKT